MMLAPLLLAQAVAGPFLPAAPRPASDKPCPIATDTSDVIVCGRTDDRFRLPRLALEAERPALPKAEVRLGSAALAAEAEQATLANGAQSQRLMMRLKMPFGGKKRP